MICNTFWFAVEHIHTFKCSQCFSPVLILFCSQVLAFCIHRPCHWYGSILLSLQLTRPTLPLPSMIQPCEEHFVRVCGTPLCTTKLFLQSSLVHWLNDLHSLLLELPRKTKDVAWGRGKCRKHSCQINDFLCKRTRV